MNIAVISDIHGNLEALREVLKDIDTSEKPDSVICLGDIVGYGADPDKCIESTREVAEIIVAGNHDFAAVGKTSIEYFNPVARRAAIWTGEILTDEHIKFLSTLQFTDRMDGIHITHGSLYRPENWRYILSKRDAYTDFQIMEYDLLLVGHSHIPVVFHLGEEDIEIGSASRVKLNKDEKYILNPGSVGQPRDGDPRASYGILDTEKRIFTIKRIEYDVKKAQQKILNAGLPEILATRLANGR